MQALVLVAALAAVSSCASRTSPNAPESALTRISDDTEAYIVVAPETPQVTPDKDSATLYAFDSTGKQLGGIRGKGMFPARAVATGKHLTFTAADAIHRLTSQESSSIPENETNIGEAAVTDPESGGIAYWFNALIERRQVTSYAVVRADGSSFKGHIDGMLQASGYCRGELYAVVREDPKGFTPSYRSWLHHITESGPGRPLSEWDNVAGFSPVSSALRCTAEGDRLLGLWGTPEATDKEIGSQGLTAVTLSLDAPYIRSPRQLDMPGIHWRVSRSSVTMINGVLIWSNLYGDILSLAPEDNRVRRLWQLNAPTNSVVAISGSSLLYVDYRGDVPEYSRYELLTGKRILGPVGLEWLRGTLRKWTESGGSKYGVVDVTAPPTP